MNLNKEEVKEIVIAVITGVVTVWTTIVQNRKTRRNSNNNAKRVINTK